MSDKRNGRDCTSMDIDESQRIPLVVNERVPRGEAWLVTRLTGLGDPPPEPGVSVAWIAVSPRGQMQAWPESRLRRWWRKRRGWTFYDGDGRRA